MFYKLGPSHAKYARAVRDERQFTVTKCMYCGAVYENRKEEEFKLHFEGKRKAIIILHLNTIS